MPARRAFLALVRRLADEGTAVLIAEHRRDRVDPIADRVIDVGGEARADLGPSRPSAPATRSSAVRGLAGGRGGRRVLAGVELAVRAGDVCAIHGPNGSGQEHARPAPGRARSARPGTIELCGRDVTALAAEERYPELALVPQDPGRFLLCDTVRAEVRSGARRSAAAEALAPLGLEALADRHPRDLSAGRAGARGDRRGTRRRPRRAGARRAHARDGPGAPAGLARLLRARAAAGRAVVLTTHDRRFAAACGAVAHELRDGRLEVAP